MGSGGSKPGDAADEVNLHHFVILGRIGKGAFGKVHAVEHHATHRIYALKTIRKQDCIRMEALKNIFRERNILERLDHPYIVNLRFAFQDECSMYMALDFMNGGDLRFHMERRRRVGFDEGAIRVWICELACAIQYLHRRHIVHRDLKPDNVLLDEAGHVHLTDFNIATQYDPLRPLISESGTCVYMAPEMFSGRGYLWHVDWWALGIMMYECVYGRRPFDGDNSEVVKRMIRQDDILFPTIGVAGVPISADCVAVMRGFLERDRGRRLCCTAESPGWEALCLQGWFDGIDWLEVEDKQVQPLFVPDPNRQNFDQAHALEEMLTDGQSALGQAAPKRTPLSRKEARDLDIIEKKFRIFDHLVFEGYRGIVDPVRLTVGDPPPWVKCVDRKEGAGGRELEEDYDPRLSRPQTGADPPVGSHYGSNRTSIHDGILTPDAAHRNSVGPGQAAVKALRKISLRHSSQLDVKDQLAAALKHSGRPESPPTPGSHSSQSRSWWFGGGGGVRSRQGSTEKADEACGAASSSDVYAVNDFGDSRRVVQQDMLRHGGNGVGNHAAAETEVVATW